MPSLFVVAALAVIAAATAYTFSYARWAARWGLRRGAIGLSVLGVLTGALPTWMLLTPR